MSKSTALKDRVVVAAWAERCNGPGWNNRVVWYLWRDANMQHHVDCLQPAEQTKEMGEPLFEMSILVHKALTSAVGRKLRGKAKA